MSTPASQRITRPSASNLALAFVLLPPDKRASMSALYAFCRQVDDVADETTLPVEQRRSELAAWREDIRLACSSSQPRFPVNRKLQPVIAQYRLPFALFDELVCGVEMDLDIQRYEDYEHLDRYCYRVASVVGLLSIEIFGYRDPACRDYALALGQALQLTNILRDVRADAERGRIYLPLQELRRFGVTPAEILGCHYSDRYGDLARSVADRARGFYQAASRALPAADRPTMIAAELMGTVYWHLWRRLEARAFNVFAAPHIHLSKPHKLWLVLRTWWRWTCHSKAPNYGCG